MQIPMYQCYMMRGCSEAVQNALKGGGNFQTAENLVLMIKLQDRLNLFLPARFPEPCRGTYIQDPYDAFVVM